MTPDNTLQSRIDAAMAFFQSHGWSHNQSAGITANLQAESNVNHTQAQFGGGPGYGLAQWEGPRQADFKAWAHKDIHESSFNEQLNFIQHELGTTQKAAGKALKATTSAGDAGAVVCKLYERPADINGQAAYRCKLAEKIATQTQFNNVIAGSSSTA